MNLTAREWIELIADPEIREKALANVNNPALTEYYDEPDKLYPSLPDALMNSFHWGASPQKSNYWGDLYDHPPALLPIPNKEREAAEAVLKEWLAYTENNVVQSVALHDEIQQFLSQKFK